MLILPVDPARGILLPGGPQTQNPAYFAVPNGLAGYWGFDEDCLDFTNSLALDLSGNGTVGTLSGATKPSLATGQVGTALLFNNSTSYVTMGSPASLTMNGSFSLSAWVNPNSVQGWVAGKGVWNTDAGYFLFIDGAGGADFSVKSGSTRVRATTPASIINGAMRHVVGIFISGVSSTIFVDGINLNTANGSITAPDNTAAFMVGGDFVSGGASYFDGLIDDVRIYNRALDPWEVIQLYQAGLAGRRDAGPNLPQYLEVA